MKRRTLLKGSLAGSAVALAASAGLLTPSSVLSAWNKPAFAVQSVSKALTSMLGTSKLILSNEVTISGPDIAENGAVVPIKISSSLANVKSLSIVVKNNPAPLLANFKLSESTNAYAAVRIKMGKTSPVMAVAETADGLFYSEKEVKVTIGGCGG
jgi:sulfur-oxidizing protein SoxY